MDKQFYVYILASKRNGTLYTGVSSDLVGRVYKHKNETYKGFRGFSSKYGCKMLVYYESVESAEEAIRREKQIKAWKRKWKLNHIEQSNPEWKDLYEDTLWLDSSLRWNDGVLFKLSDNQNTLNYVASYSQEQIVLK